MAGKAKVARWWDMIRYRYTERLGVPAKPYIKLSKEEQDIVYRYWATGKTKQGIN